MRSSCPPSLAPRALAALLPALLSLGAAAATAAPAPPPTLQEQTVELDGEQWRLRLPVGYRLEALAPMNRPRFFIFDQDGVLLAGSASGKLYRAAPPYRTAETLAVLPGYPHSVALRGGRLFAALTDGVYATAYPPAARRLSRADFKLIASLPGGGGHASRSLGVGPDGRLYLGIGISGNCSDEYLDDAYPFARRRGGVLALDERGDKPRWLTFASGLRNPIGFAWRPAGVPGAGAPSASVLYATNNGPDHHGYELPPEYFSRLEPGSFHGMPWFWHNGRGIERDNCIERKPPRKDAVLPEAVFPARNAPMGVAFAAGDMFRPVPRGDAAVALRGSWATQPDGKYFGDRASRRPPWLAVVRFANGRAARVDELLTGLQNARGDRALRPVGIAFGPDGALYFTSDGGENEGLFRLIATSP